ncbi:tellurite resistance TerB family protein [Flexibacterium corallicola]|uniref:tellurite resistance TerB family protein n=1 Tax=Flexibacterium corallicola TaxID=3037259 RepID=UPI00286F4AEA|nr:tellurite resistance TerB family protein [Pseudovibrio sp. M1P-2-3]
MINTKQLLDQFLGAGQSLGGKDLGNQAGDFAQKGKQYLQNNAGGLAGGAMAGGLAGMLLGSKKGHKIGKKAVQVGGLALVGGLAYKAYQSYQANKNNPQSDGGGQAQPMQGKVLPPVPPQGPSAAQGQNPFNRTAEDLPEVGGTAFDPHNCANSEEHLSMSLITAMIQAAKADGHIDAQEQKRIFDRIDEANLGMEAKAFIMDEMRAPLDIDRVVQSATTPELAAELYTVSRMTIEPNDPAEKAYLMMLAARLNLEEGFISEIDKAVAQAQMAG